ncbi:hypothetical protein CAPTEDRAFT_228334 [Capitella teleta]|uniref:Exostosin GT47 domain-containing protein n=1 Tax=Capitella teleta TaxID=283909 RepID=R7VKJ9_CAPTE|nr:hypothetical protein CAPTEDRAFT_228334 [Capitella teleta]|eukprot:ELU17436.1 hypothetical protein CAPTEDRAFT_228334 [Capitella teleta]
MATVDVKVERVLYIAVVVFTICAVLHQMVLPGWRRKHTQRDILEDLDLIEPAQLLQFESENSTEPYQQHVACETIVQQPLADAYAYSVITKTDSQGGDLMAVQTKNIGILRKVCDALPQCAGFNSNGWLKKRIGQKYKSSVDLYFKESAPLDEEVYLSSQIIEGNYGKDYIRMTKELKIYMYTTKIDAHINYVNDWKYGVEELFIHLLKSSPYITQDPSEATFFFLPFRCFAYRKTISDRDRAQRFTEEMVSKILYEIKSNYSFWDRTLGADHFYVCAHDFGPAIVAGSDPFLHKNAIAMVNTADYEHIYYVPHKDISLPPHPSHGKNSLANIGKGGHGLNPSDRTVLAFYAGNLDRGRIRPSIKDFWSTDIDFRIFMGHLTDERYQHYLKTSKFCLILRGNEAWSPCLMDAIWFGCVPVIISDYYDLPLHGMLDWNQFAVVIRESKVKSLKEILLAVSPQKLTSMQEKLKQVYGHFVWNDPPRPYDAFQSVMYQLWKRRGVVRYI